MKAGRSAKSVPTGNIDLVPITVVPESIADGTNEMKFREKLLGYGLDELRVEVLVMRFFYDMTLREISDELSLANPSTALYLLDSSLAELKEKGYST
jgi:DNA-directed RNA polymerase specialized sigma subunit